MAAVGLSVTAASLTGCASDTGARDEGAASRLSPPASASPLWPGSSPSAAPAAPELSPYPPVKGVAVPADGLKGLPVRELLENDPNVPDLVRKLMQDCRGSACSQRSPVYRDLTGDGRDEVIVAVDAARIGQTLLSVYRASGGQVRPVLSHWGEPGLTGETIGRDLVITATGREGPYTTRYRWNGKVLAAVAAQNPQNPQNPQNAQNPHEPQAPAEPSAQHPDSPAPEPAR
ncbi:hypothetical protein HCC61_01510 [Streptomyces sp. HNM0575]|uniref:hypothetical protein n=1 Tax=Streptomyces sp. HNM0575 TaxID=2716338 RepID=UPI00145F5D8E|nr:hypothetical protein [Streptomyces sp. HNM0575]NLU71386.1 hypothetical protein [Streptomyces sp. HNM0575]